MNSPNRTHHLHYAAFLIVILSPVAAFAQNHGVEGRVSDLERKVLAFEQELIVQNQSLTSLNQQVQALTSQIGRLAEQLSAQLQGLSGQVNNLSARVSNIEPYNPTVDCALGQSINSALAGSRNRPGFVTITIKGTCTEQVQLNRSHTTLQGDVSGGGIVAPTGATAVNISAATGVRLSSLVIQGGAVVVRVNSGAQVQIENSQISLGSFHGIQVNSGSLLALSATSVFSNGGSGIYAIGGSVELNQSTIFENAFQGLSLESGSDAQVMDSSVVSANRSGGISLNGGSALKIRGTVKDNSGIGVSVLGGSAVILENATISGNSFDGVALGDAAVLQGFGYPPTFSIVNNGGRGVSCTAAPSVPQMEIPASSIGANSGGATNCASLL